MNRRNQPAGVAMQVTILLVAGFMSLLSLGHARRFHPDEAFYMTSARHAAVNGDWLLLAEPLDKPPLTFYTNALALVLFAIETDANGVLQLAPLKGEFAGRLPSVFLSIMSVAVTMRLALLLTDQIRAAWIAGFLMALSPFRIAFAATAFTDIPMLFFALLALWMAAAKRPVWAGLWFVVSLSAKPQSLFYLPLLIFFLSWPALLSVDIKRALKRLIIFAVSIIIGIGLLWAWDQWRIGQGAISFYTLGQSRYTPVTITPLALYPERLYLWWSNTQYTLGHGLMTLGLVSYAAIAHIFVKRQHHLPWGIMIFWIWVLAFVSVHIVLTLNLFDRNQLVWMPILILITADGLSRWRPRGAIVLIYFAGAYFGIQAALWQMPIGGDDGRHDQIDALADYLNSKPIATVIYDRWLDWELDYYMGQWSNKRRVYYPTPNSLVAGAQALDEVGTRYFVVPITIEPQSWLAALEAASFTVTYDTTIGQFDVYQIEPPA